MQVLRGVAARMLCKYAGLTQRETADVLGVSSSATAHCSTGRSSVQYAGGLGASHATKSSRSVWPNQKLP